MRGRGRLTLADLDPRDRAEVETFQRFLDHHLRTGPPGIAGGAVCSCGVAAKLGEGGRIEPQPNPACDCPCHDDGYVGAG